jgi:hypothetical protein
LDVPFITSLELLLLLVNFTKMDQIKFYILSPTPCHSAAAAACCCWLVLVSSAMQEPVQRLRTTGLHIKIPKNQLQQART